MPVEIFTQAEFESKALPTSKTSGEKLWKYAGLQNGEHTYLVPVSGVENIAIEVRSSVHSNGVSAETGADSIRCWIVDTLSGKPWGSKVSRWTTRLPGWGERTLNVIRELYRMAQHITNCPKCGKGRLKVFKVKKEGPNKGKVFLSCPADENCEFNRQNFANRILGNEDGEAKAMPVAVPKLAAFAVSIPADKAEDLKRFVLANGGLIS